VKFATAAEPGILMRQLLWGHKLSEAIIYGDLVILEKVLVLSLSRLFWKALRILFGPDHILE